MEGRRSETLMPVFECDGLAFHYLDEGDPSGRNFVFQHGLGDDVSQPAGVFSPPPGIRLLSVDCRGYGETYPLGGARKLSFSCFADDVAALMDRPGFECAVVGGISMAAGVALNLASRYPRRVAGWSSRDRRGSIRRHLRTSRHTQWSPGC